MNKIVRHLFILFVCMMAYISNVSAAFLIKSTGVSCKKTFQNINQSNVASEDFLPTYLGGHSHGHSHHSHYHPRHSHTHLHYYYHRSHYHDHNQTDFCTAALVWSIIGCPLAFIVFGGLFGIIGIIFGIIGSSMGCHRKTAKSGIILGVIDILIAIAAACFLLHIL